MSLKARKKQNILCKDLFFSGPIHFSFNGHNYFYTGHEPGFENKTYTFDGARNVCQEFCMEPISIETETEFNMTINLMKKYKISYLWTSGRLCETGRCSVTDRLSTWKWLGSGEPIDASENIPVNYSNRPWSHTGIKLDKSKTGNLSHH